MQTIRLIVALLAVACLASGCDPVVAAQKKKEEFVAANEEFVINEFSHQAGERAKALARQALLVNAPKGRETGLIDIDDGILVVTFKREEGDLTITLTEAEKIIAARLQEWKDAHPDREVTRVSSLLETRANNTSLFRGVKVEHRRFQ